MHRGPDPRAFWDRAAGERPAWYIATGHEVLSDRFFQQGSDEVDAFLAHTGVSVAPTDRLLEIGCGAGRMTGRLAALAGQVVALDVSPKMIGLARERLSEVTNVEYVVGSGSDLRPLPDASIDVVFSYVTLQHVPTKQAHLGYLREICRVLTQGGRAAVQVRAPGWRPAAVDLAGQVARAVRGRRTLRPEWRGARLARRDILTAIEPDVEVAFVPHGLRHLWVVLRRPVPAP